MACLTAPPPIELPEDACTSESVVVSGHDASLASERKGWRVLRTAENGAKAQRLVVALPSPARIHSIQLNTKNCGRISIFVSGAETGPNSYVGQANVAAAFRGSNANVVEALAPCTLTQQDAALNFTIGKGDGKLNPTVAQNVCEKLYINVHSHPALEPGELFGISRLEIIRQVRVGVRARARARVRVRVRVTPTRTPTPTPTEPTPTPTPTPHPHPHLTIRQLSDAERARAAPGASVPSASRPVAVPVVVPMRPMPQRPPPQQSAPPASRAAAASEPAPNTAPRPQAAVQRPRGPKCGCDTAGCVGCGPPCKNHGQKSRLQKAKRSGKPFWVCPLPGGCGFQRDALETLTTQARPHSKPYPKLKPNPKPTPNPKPKPNPDPNPHPHPHPHPNPGEAGHRVRRRRGGGGWGGRQRQASPRSRAALRWTSPLPRREEDSGQPWGRAWWHGC